MNDELLLRSALGQTTQREEGEVVGWRTECAANDAHFEDLRHVLLLTAEADDALSFGSAPTVEELQDVARSTGRLRSAVRRVGGSWGLLLGAASAAALLAFTMPMVRDAAKARGPSPVGVPFASDEFVTETEPATVGLRDGSLVRLAPETRLQVHAREDAREVSLNGRGYFAVAPDRARPFTIRSDAGTVTVLGTRFDLTIAGQDLLLIVVEGSVGLTARGASVEVGAGQLARVVRGNLVPPVDVPDPSSLIGWVGNFIAFQDTPLRVAAAEIERRHGVRLEFADPRVGDRTVTAWFAGRDVEEIVEVICMVTQLQCVRAGDVLRMTPLY